MIVTRCDRCGRDIPPDTGVSFWFGDLPIQGRDLKHLCESCFSELTAWMLSGFLARP